ncbi:hypothetical protein MMC28_008827 [Mycoblastus sanguinarius]|nr:hypothetical protein [Mycoblastus sanguinarius]
MRSRVLLYRQDELCKLETKLLRLDEADNKESEESRKALRSRKHDEGRDSLRKTLIQQIDDKMKQYDDMVNRIQIYVTLKAPSSRNFKSFRTWIFNEKPLTREESGFLNHRDDFVALSDERECSWLDGVVEDVLERCLPRLVMDILFTSPEQRLKTDDPKYVQLRSKHRIDVLVRLILTMMTVGLLVGPSAVLFLVSGHSALKIGLIMIFTLLFSLALGVGTKAKRHEMVAATAT